jgi:hypothetical protein
LGKPSRITVVSAQIKIVLLLNVKENSVMYFGMDIELLTYIGMDIELLTYFGMDIKLLTYL